MNEHKPFCITNYDREANTLTKSSIIMKNYYLVLLVTPDELFQKELPTTSMLCHKFAYFLHFYLNRPIEFHSSKKFYLILKFEL